MKKATFVLLLFSLTLAFAIWRYYPQVSTIIAPLPVPKPTKPLPPLPKLKARAKQARPYIHDKGFNNRICFFIDMSMHSGLNRFFVYDLQADSILHSGLVAHGSCNKAFLSAARFSNTVGCGCSATGRYRVSYRYKGQFGYAYKLYGLDTTNNNAFERNIVLHAYDCVPDAEIYPVPICNSLGCPMVSYAFLNRLAGHIQKSPKPILLWMFN